MTSDSSMTRQLSSAEEESVEGFVRASLAKALGGRRGMLETGVPTAAFTLLFLTTHNLVLAIAISGGLTLLALLVRLAQRGAVQYVLNAGFGIAIGAFFAYRSARQGGSVDDQALAFFLPGVLVNTAYSVGLILSVVLRWPLIGFMIGAVLGDPLGWRTSSALIRVCCRLTLVLAAPNVLRAVVQGPLYLAGVQGWLSSSAAVSALGVAKLVMGWPLQVAAFAIMIVLLKRNSTPLDTSDPLVDVAADPRSAT